MKRFGFDFLLFVSIFALPWWLTALLALVGLFLFKNFYEFLVTGAIVFSLFSEGTMQFISSRLWFPLLLGAIFIGVQILRNNIILYRNDI